MSSNGWPSARALVAGPSVLFADEPTGELDSVTGITIATILRDIARERGVTVITATHDLALAGMCTRRLEMADGEFVNGFRWLGRLPKY